MTSTTPSPAPSGVASSPPTRAVAYSVPTRLGGALLVAVSRGGLVFLLTLLLVYGTPPPLAVMRAFTILFIGPGALAWLVEWACTVEVEVIGGDLVLRHRRRRTEVPCAAIAAVVPWVVPLPGSGIWLRLRSGRRLRYGLQLPDPAPLGEALVAAGASDVARALEHPSIVYAHAKHGGAPSRWYHYAGKYVLFALAPTLPLFRVHQLIAYGGTWGEWYLLGPASYLKTFAIYWGTLIIYVLLYGAALRALCELPALVTAWVAPSHAARARRAVELAHRVLYYGGVPMLVLIRLWPW